MNEDPRAYNFHEVTLLIGGVPIKGFIGPITFKAAGKKRMSVSGLDGEVAVSIRKDPRAELAFDLMQTSLSNAYLSGLHALSEVNGTSFTTYSLRDRNGSSLHEGTCWIEDLPETAYGESAGPRKWLLGCVEKKRVDGGNVRGTVAV